MDFPTPPRRVLQALCKRNGVLANMTNARMAAALRALPKVDGIEEYVKQQPVAVPEPAVEEQQNLEKQESIGLGQEGRKRDPAGRRLRPLDSMAMDFLTLSRCDLQALCMRNGVRANMTSAAMADALRALPMVAGSEEYFRAPIPRGSLVKAKSSELQEVEREDMKPDEKKEDAPPIGVPAEAPAKRRSTATSEEGAGDVAMKPVPVRATRQCKPTLKAAAAVEEKASRWMTKGAVGKALGPLLQEEHQEPHEAVPAPVSDQCCDAHDQEMEEPSDPRKDELNEVDAPKQDEDEDVVVIEETLVKWANVEVAEEKTPPVVHAVEQMDVTTADEFPELTEVDDEVVVEMKTPLIGDDKQQSTGSMTGYIVDDHFETLVAYADELKEVGSSDVPGVTGTEIEEKTPLIVDEKKQSTVTMDEDVVFDHFKTDIAHGEEQKQGTDDEVIEEKAALINIPNITHTVDECLMKNHFRTDFSHGNKQKKEITVDNSPEASRTEDAREEYAFNSNIPQELNLAEDSGEHIIPALLDHVAESLSKSIVTMEPSVSVTEDTSMCKNSIEKITTKPVAVQQEKGVKVMKNPVDLYTLSLRQLRAMLKEKLNAKKNREAKRVALAKVDENVRRSPRKGQQLNLNLQH